jgi:hypothetical protein
MIRRPMLLALVAPLALAPVALAHADPAGVERRQDRQEQRIAGGVRSGELTARETRTLIRQQGRIEMHESRASADGVVTARERVRLDAQQDHASRAIYRKKHNARDRG